MSQYKLYAGGYASADQPGIHVFTFDTTSGALVAQGAVAGITNPSFLILHPNGRWLYAVSETVVAEDGVPGAVWALRMTDAPPGLEPINQQASGGDAPCHPALDATGRWLVVTNYGSGTVGVLPIQADGALGEQTDLVQHHGHGPHPERQTGPHTHSATFTPDGRFVIVADLGIDALVTYRFDPTAGRLQEHGQISTRPGAGPRHLAFHPNGRHLYAANELDNTVGVYAYDAAQATLAEQQISATLPPGAPENTVADIHVTPAGDRVYVSNRGHDSIATFSIAADGRLERIAIQPCGGRWPRNFAIAPEGRFLLVANHYSDDVSVLPVLESAALGPPSARAAVPGAACIQFVAS
jgi:6-phosphogluconolactonase